MHVISDGTILTLVFSLFTNVCLLAYIATGYTDKEEAE